MSKKNKSYAMTPERLREAVKQTDFSKKHVARLPDLRLYTTTSRVGGSRRKGRNVSNRFFARLLVLATVAGCAVEPRGVESHRLEVTEFRTYWDDATVRDRLGERRVACDALCDDLTRSLTLHVHQEQTDAAPRLLFSLRDRLIVVDAVGPILRDELQEVRLTMPSTDGPLGGGHTRREQTALRQTEDLGLRGFVTWWLSPEQTITLMLTAVPQ